MRKQMIAIGFAVGALVLLALSWTHVAADHPRLNWQAAPAYQFQISATPTEPSKPNEAPPLPPIGAPIVPTSLPLTTGLPVPTQAPESVPTPEPLLVSPELAIAGEIAFLIVVFGVLLTTLILRWRGRNKATTLLTVPYLELASTGLKLYLTRNTMTLGCASDCNLRIARKLPGADTVSDYHARLEKRATRWAIVDGVTEDARSLNGIYVNGKRTLENYLFDGDEITCGEMKFHFHIPTTYLATLPGDAR